MFIPSSNSLSANPFAMFANAAPTSSPVISASPFISVKPVLSLSINPMMLSQLILLRPPVSKSINSSNINFTCPRPFSNNDDLLVRLSADILKSFILPMKSVINLTTCPNISPRGVNAPPISNNTPTK